MGDDREELVELNESVQRARQTLYGLNGRLNASILRHRANAARLGPRREAIDALMSEASKLKQEISDAYELQMRNVHGSLTDLQDRKTMCQDEWAQLSAEDKELDDLIRKEEAKLKTAQKKNERKMSNLKTLYNRHAMLQNRQNNFHDEESDLIKRKEGLQTELDEIDQKKKVYSEQIEASKNSTFNYEEELAKVNQWFETESTNLQNILLELQNRRIAVEEELKKLFGDELLKMIEDLQLIYEKNKETQMDEIRVEFETRVPFVLNVCLTRLKINEERQYGAQLFEACEKLEIAMETLRGELEILYDNVSEAKLMNTVHVSVRIYFS